MTDLRGAVQVAVFERLAGAAEVTALAPVFEFIPERDEKGDEVEPPYIVIDRMDATPIGGKDGGLDQVEFDVLTVMRKPGRVFLTPMMAAVRNALEGAKLVSADAILSAPEFVGDEDELTEDGQTYLGRQRFSLIAQPRS